MEQAHIVKSYDRELDLLKGKLGEMGRAAEIQIVNAVKALVKGDELLASDTVKKDDGINRWQEEVDTLTLRMLLSRQPMATDLRRIIAGQKIAADLERIADYAANIAKHSLDLKSLPECAPVEHIHEMAEIAADMIRQVMSAYTHGDLETAVTVWHRDDAIDSLYTTLIKALHDCMNDQCGNITPFTRLLFVARCCERIGDHITNIAESTYFMITGRSYGKSINTPS